jgi:hypothetical protein
MSALYRDRAFSSVASSVSTNVLTASSQITTVSGGDPTDTLVFRTFNSGATAPATLSFNSVLGATLYVPGNAVITSLLVKPVKGETLTLLGTDINFDLEGAPDLLTTDITDTHVKNGYKRQLNYHKANQGKKLLKMNGVSALTGNVQVEVSYINTGSL